MGKVYDKLEAMGVPRQRAKRLCRVLERMAHCEESDIAFFATRVNTMGDAAFDAFMFRYWGGTEARAAADDAPAVKVAHAMEVTHTNDEDGIHLHCSCGWDANLGYGASVSKLADAEMAHLRGVTERSQDPQLTPELLRATLLTVCKRALRVCLANGYGEVKDDGGLTLRQELEAVIKAAEGGA